MEHTKEPWSVSNNEAITIRDSSDNQLAIMIFMRTKTGGRRECCEVESNANRIVRCVNALAGLPQDALDGGWNYKDLCAYAAKLEKQRDELLEALRRIESEPINAEYMAREAIEKSEPV